MAEPFIFLNTYAISPDRAETLKRGFQATAELVQAREPRMLYFGLHISEDGTEATTVQVHADAENMAFHMRLVGDHIRKATEYLDFSSMRIQIFGTPTDAIVDQVQQLAGSGVPVTISPAAICFDRFSPT